MENPALGGAPNSQAGRSDISEYTRKTHVMQAAVCAIGAGLICQPDVCDTSVILRRLDLPARIWLAASALLSLPPDEAEELAEAALHDLRAGEPIPPFTGLRDESQSWAMLASRAERCHYLAAAWGELSPDDRRRFLRRAL